MGRIVDIPICLLLHPAEVSDEYRMVRGCMQSGRQFGGEGCAQRTAGARAGGCNFHRDRILSKLLFRTLSSEVTAPPVLP